ncbi:chemotaxis protein CheW [Massilia pinisoli]|uniref:Chemotaxis protein CheW n=1 Tax=Massilia pinisoli TaxID=1772194 RepID=A0ABT1ZPV5_9BURK|nr:chemotaxis protein CheW [Massilia pinisoli]MCS0581953.1 chemotaxis protein CheW [Massilia pinisoli]
MDASDAGGQKGAARRARLRQYQEQLLERMQAARTSSGARAHQLGVEIGGARYLFDLVEAGEIVPLPPLAAVPLTQPWYLGLANVRGSLVGVVDLARYLDPDAAPSAAPAAGARLVTFAPGLAFPCALLVGRVVGLRHAADMTSADGGLLDADGREWTPLSLAALAREERFLQVAR